MKTSTVIAVMLTISGAPITMVLEDGMASQATASGKDSVQTGPLCESVMAAASTCAFEESCNAETPMMLSAANRDALVTMEHVRGFSIPAFARYCAKACTSRSSEIDVDAFTHDVCGLDTEGRPLRDSSRQRHRR